MNSHVVTPGVHAHADERLLGMRGQAHQTGISSGMRVQLRANPAKRGKTSIAVMGGDDAKWLM